MKTKIIFQSIMEVDIPKEYKRINSIKWASKAQKDRLLKLIRLFEEKKYGEFIWIFQENPNVFSVGDELKVS